MKYQENLEEIFMGAKHAFHLRMDIHASEEKMNELFDKFQSSTWIYSRERDPKEHTHIVILTEYEPTATTINRWIKEIFDLKGSKKSTSKVRTTVKRAITYICKEGDILFKGFTRNLIDGLKAQSTLKFSKEKIANDLFELETKYYKGDITDEKFAQMYGTIRAQYGQPHNRNSIVAYISKHYFRKHTEERDRFYLRCLESLNPYI